MNSTKSTQLLKHGEEPTELLLALASSPIETLCQRSQVDLFLANAQDGQPLVLAIFKNATIQDGVIVLAKDESVGKETANTEEVLETPKNVPVTKNNGHSKTEKA